MITDRNHKNQTIMEEKDSRMVILADTLSAIIAATIATYTAKNVTLYLRQRANKSSKKRVQGKLIRQTEKQIKKKNNDAMILFIGFIYKTLK